MKNGAKIAFAFTLFLLLPGLVEASNSAKEKYGIACKVELSNGNSTANIATDSAVFEGSDPTETSELKLELGAYTLRSQIENRFEMTSAKSAPGPRYPHFSVLLFKGSKSTKSVFRTGVDGFRWGSILRPFTLSGQIDLNLNYEKVNYNLVAFKCWLHLANEGVNTPLGG